jgi:hypothetical protein
MSLERAFETGGAADGMVGVAVDTKPEENELAGGAFWTIGPLGPEGVATAFEPEGVAATLVPEDPASVGTECD